MQSARVSTRRARGFGRKKSRSGWAPVREALGRLHEKGLVESAANGRGLAVAVLSRQQIFELYAMRAELEALVARFAFQHATEAEIGNLKRINTSFEKAQTPTEAARLNRQFHAGIYDAAKNRYLRAAVEYLQETVALLPMTTFLHEGRTSIAAREHAAIVAAIAARDPEAGAEAATTHIRRALDTRLELMGDNEI